jgi:uncharacterized membrane protein YccC
LSGLRSAGVLLVLSVFWIASAWPEGTGAMTFATLFCVLFGALPAPIVALKRVARGCVLGQAMAFVCLFWVLPHAEGFTSMALGLLPFLIFSAWLIEHPRYAVEGLGVFLCLFTAIGTNNQMHYDIAGFLNNGLAIFIGVGAAGVAFVLSPPSIRRLRIRLLTGLRRQTADACLAPLGNALDNDLLRHRFESRTRDLLYQLSTAPASTRDDVSHAMGYAMAILEVGQAVIELRIVCAGLTQAQACMAAEKRALDAIFTLCQRPSGGARLAAVEALDSFGVCLDDLADLNARDAALRDQLQLDCYLIRSLIQDNEWFRQVDRSAHPDTFSIGTNHAA